MTRRLRLHIVAASAVLVLAIWLSSGTLSPVAATVDYPRYEEPCHYLVSIDHYHWVAIFSMLRGEPPEMWIGSVMLRRLLFHVIALPFVNVFGVLVGGFIASCLIHLVATAGFAVFIARRIGETAAIAVLWLLATYPGITYWAGLPYGYVIIVPGSIACFLLLYRIHEAQTAREVVIASLLMSVVFLGYDLFAFFAPATVLVLLARRRFAWVFIACAGMASMLLLVGLMFMAMGVPIMNSSTGNYVGIMGAYLHPTDLQAWRDYVLNVPAVLVSNFFASNFVVLPLLFAVALVVAWRRRLAIFQSPEVALLVAAVALFLFNNAAPPYYGWQLRGHWIARLYQPLFVVLLIVIARVTQEARAHPSWRFALVGSVVLNASLAVGPMIKNPVAPYVYSWFYTHAAPQSFFHNLDRFGRRPLGVCSTSHEWDNIPDPNTPWNRPAYVYRYPPAQ